MFNFLFVFTQNNTLNEFNSIEMKLANDEVIKKNLNISTDRNGRKIISDNTFSPNTTYIIQNEFELNNKEVRIPKNVTLRFDGGSFTNGTIILNNTKVEAGNQNIFKNTKLVGSLTGTINIKWFGAYGDGKTDDTKAFKDAILSSNTLGGNNGWKNNNKIYIPNGKYIITENIYPSNAYDSRIVLEGDGWQNTEVIFNPKKTAFLLNNPGLFGFTTIKGVKFTGNRNAKFVNFVGGLSGDAQSMIFEKCFFDNFEQIMNVTGETMGSEVTFRDCKIKGGSNNAVLFSFSNDQAVNWRFYGTDIEAFSGVLFDFLEGTSINFYQGSIIPVNGIVMRINKNSNPNTFGTGVFPLLNINGVRFELRGNSKLVTSENSSVNFNLNFDNCGMGGFNLNNNTFPIDIKGKGTIIFNNCHNLSNYKFKFQVDDKEDYLNPARIIFRENSPPLKDIDASVCNKVVNDAAYPIIIFQNTGLNCWYRIFNKDNFVSPLYWELKQHIITKKDQPQAGMLITNIIANKNKEIYFELPNISIHSLQLVINKTAGNYRSQQFKIKLWDHSKTNLLAEGLWNTDENIILQDKRGFFYNPPNSGVKVELIPIQIKTSDLIFPIYIKAEF